ncbi:MAG: hypothetical protein COA78_06010 [Blastopirellula sp.]|nr:MAG: hypothetical protein COA78_06010 [Blastopirellula sp.]
MTFRFLLLIVGFLVLAGSAVQAKEPWEYSPYQIKVWTIISGHPSFDASAQEQLNQYLEDRAWSAVGSVWKLQAESAPLPLRQLGLRDIEEINLEQIKSLSPELIDEIDKLVILVVSYKNNRTEISARELDCRTRIWGPKHQRNIVQQTVVASESFELILQVFSPIGIIDKVVDLKTSVVLKAQGLIVQYNSPANLPNGHVMFPVIRRNDRTGKLREPGGIQLEEWTYLKITGEDWQGKLCNVSSGFSRPLGGRKSVRIERLAIAAKPDRPTTMLTLETKGEDPVPLEGYEIYAKDTENAEPVLIGETDYNGRIEIPYSSESMLRLLYVRSGNNLLARLPVVPGLNATMIAKVADDARRLDAEGYLYGWRDQVVDTVARRQLLARRIRKELSNGNVENADKWYQDFKELKTVDELTQEVRKAKANFQQNDRVTQARIDKLFVDAQELAGHHRDQGLANTLRDEVNAAKKAKLMQ